MKRMIHRLVRNIRALDSALVERGRPSRRGYELVVAPPARGPRYPRPSQRARGTE